MFNTEINVTGVDICFWEMVTKLWKQEDFKFMVRHAAMGVGGEAGELIDCLKKFSVYDKDLDRANLVEELGDMMFYLTIIMFMFGLDEKEILQANANKLSKRYAGLVYSDAAAQQRADKQDEAPRE